MSLLGFKRDRFDDGDPYPTRPARSWSHAKELAMGVAAVLILTVAFVQTRPDSDSAASNQLRFDESTGRETGKKDGPTDREVEKALRKAANEEGSPRKKRLAAKGAAVNEAPIAPMGDVDVVKPAPRESAPKEAPQPVVPAPQDDPEPAFRTFTAAQIRGLPSGSTIESVTAKLGAPLAASDMRQRFSAEAVQALLRQAPAGYICRYYALAPGEPAPYVRLCFNANGALRARDFVAPVA
jgi:hypothetical protein